MTDPGDALLTAWLNFEVVESDVTDESMRRPRPTPVADLPFPTHGGRILLCRAREGELNRTVQDYFTAIGHRPQASQIPITSDLLKVLYQERRYDEIIRGVKSENKQVGYEGDAQFQGHKGQDVRNDPKFEELIEAGEQWTRLKFVPQQEPFRYDGVPPVVELQVGGTMRLWASWLDERVVRLVRDMCGVILDLQGIEPDDDLLLEAAPPPHKQTPLSDFFGS